MTTAAEIISKLEGNEYTGMCRCPVHDDQHASLHVSEGYKGAVFYCHAGCPQEKVLAALQERGLMQTKPGHFGSSSYFRRREMAWRRDAQEDEIKRFRVAMHILRACGDEKPTDYLKRRGIRRVPVQAMLLSAGDAERLTRIRYPAMVLPIVRRSPDGILLTGAHVTFLTKDGRDNARGSDGKSVRRTYGVVKGGFGRRAAAQLAERREYEGYNDKVTIVMPPTPGKDWNDILRADEDQAKEDWRAALAHEEERQPTELSHPVEDFMELTFPKREMLMDPWLPQPGIAMIFAKAGHAKTFLALGVAFAVARGEEFLGWKCGRSGKVLYIDGEMPGSYLQQRLAVYGSVPKGRLHIVCRDNFNLRHEMMPDLGTPEGRRVIDDIIKRVKPDLVILDSLSTLERSGEESSAEDWIQVQDWIMHHRWQGRSILIIHHAGKSGDQRGTSKRMDTPETTIKLTKQTNVEKEKDESAFELEFIKGRELFGEREDAMMLRLAIRNGEIKWRHEPKRNTIKEAVRARFAAGMKGRDIAKELGITESRVSQLKRELEQEETSQFSRPRREKA